MNILTILFDFDGTLADMNEIVFEILNQLAREFDFKEMTEETARRFQNMHPKEVLKENKISLLKIPFLLVRGRQLLKEHIQTVKLIPNIISVLTQLKANGKRLGIVTSNSVENVKLVLNRYKAVDLFDFVYSENTIFGKEKALKKVLAQEKLKVSSVVYVGDEVRDVEAAKKCGISCIAVTWGINGKSILQQSGPTWIVSAPREIVKLLS